MRTRYKLMILWGIGHLTLVSLATAGISPVLRDSSWVVVDWYRHLSGADNRFDFFAPGVGPQQRVVFTLTDADGRQWSDDLRLGRTHEANVSFSTIPFVLDTVDDDAAWNMMESMAEAMFQRHASAIEVQVRVEAFAAVQTTEGVPETIDFPSMGQYRAGQRAEWIPLYQLTFPASAPAQLSSQYSTEAREG